MRSLLFLLLAFFAASAHCDDIAGVLQRSHQQRLDAFEVADAQSPATQRVRESFDAVMRSLQVQHSIELRVVKGSTIAETIHGSVVVANESLGDLPEGQRIFILAHEIGHVVLGHWAQMNTVYQKWIPDTVTQQQTDAVAASLGKDASALARRQEHEADEFGLRSLRAFGRPVEDAFAVFRHYGMHGDTATHPSVGQRIAFLRTLTQEQAPVTALHTAE